MGANVGLDSGALVAWYRGAIAWTLRDCHLVAAVTHLSSLNTFILLKN